MNITRRRIIHGALVCIALCPGFTSPALGQSMRGFGEALQDIGGQLQRHAEQEAFLKRQHELEIQRIERANQLEQQQLERREAILRDEQRLAATQEARAVESAHPGWRNTVTTSAFKTWMERQPSSVRSLASSSRSQDAILMLDLFKQHSTGQ